MVHLFTSEQAEFIKENVKGRSNPELTSMFNLHFGIDLGLNQIKSFKKNHKLSSGLDGRFNKDRKPWNKGMKGLEIGGKETQFKTGHKPHNYKPVGSERINVDGYIEIKVSDPNKWRHKHVVIWEKANGPVPKKHAIIFGDGNKQNLELDNLILVSRRQLSYLNKNNLIQNDVELTRTGILVADILGKMSELKKGANK